MMSKQIQKVLGVMALAVAVTAVGFSSSAQAATADEVWWDWDMESTGGDVVWDSGEPFLNPDWGVYFAELEITVAEIDVFDGAVTLDILSLFDGTSESALIPIQPPFVLYSDTLDFDDGDEDPANDTLADATLWVDEFGEGHGALANVQLGTFNGNQISRLRLAGTLHIACVPEPSALALLGCGGFAALIVVRRRR
jgi:hypothetical protein